MALLLCKYDDSNSLLGTNDTEPNIQYSSRYKLRISSYGFSGFNTGCCLNYGCFFGVLHSAVKVYSEVSEGSTAFAFKMHESGTGGCQSNWKQCVGHTGPDWPKFHSNHPIYVTHSFLSPTSVSTQTTPSLSKERGSTFLGNVQTNRITQCKNPKNAIKFLPTSSPKKSGITL
jgi:hypothetical protein